MMQSAQSVGDVNRALTGEPMEELACMARYPEWSCVVLINDEPYLRRVTYTHDPPSEAVRTFTYDEIYRSRPHAVVQWLNSIHRYEDAK